MKEAIEVCIIDVKIMCVSNYRYTITKSSNWIAVIWHPRDGSPIMWQIGTRRTNRDQEFCLNGSIKLLQKTSVDIFKALMYQSIRSFNIPPWAYPKHLTSFLAREEGNLITAHRGWGIWSLPSMSCYEINHGRRRQRHQTLMNSKEKITYLWRIGWKPKVYTSCVLYLKVFKTDLHL